MGAAAGRAPPLGGRRLAHPLRRLSGVTCEPVALPRFAVVDIETSGLSTRRHRILQIGLVTVVGGRVADQWSTLVRLRWPWQRLGPRNVHGLTRRQLRDAPTLRSALVELAGRLDGAVFTAHNAQFDADFIERAARREGVALRLGPRLCTLRLSRQLDPDRTLSHRLIDICSRYGIEHGRPHDALYDALAAASVLPHLLAEHGVHSGESLATLYAAR